MVIIINEIRLMLTLNVNENIRTISSLLHWYAFYAIITMSASERDAALSIIVSYICHDDGTTLLPVIIPNFYVILKITHVDNSPNRGPVSRGLCKPREFQRVTSRTNSTDLEQTTFNEKYSTGDEPIT